MPGEERLEVGLPALVEAAEREREPARGDEKDHDEHVRDRRRKVARELAAEDGDHRAHAVAPPVIDRNTSSRRPDSRCSSASSQRWLSASALIGASGSLPRAGNAVMRPLFGSTSVLSTSFKPSIALRAAGSSSGFASLSDTALWNR